MLSAGSQVGIVGGGLSGLCLALACQRAGLSVTVYEAQARLGGQLYTELAASGLADPEEPQTCVIELGAEGFVASSVAAESLARTLGIEQDLVQQSTNVSFAFDGRSIRQLEPGEAASLLGFQVPKSELGRGIRSLRHGSAQLTDELAHCLEGKVSIRRGDAVIEVADSEGRLRVTSTSATLVFDAVVIATEARSAGKVLTQLLGAKAAALLSAETLSSVNVSLVYPSSALAGLCGSGFIALEEGAQGGFRACSYSSLKLPYRAPKGVTILRAFFRPEGSDIQNLPDSAWAARAEEILQRALGFTERASLFRVARWQNALPVHSEAFRGAVRDIETSLNPQRVYLAGAAFHGSGLDAALRSTDVAIRQLCGVNTLYSVA